MRVGFPRGVLVAAALAMGLCNLQPTLVAAQADAGMDAPQADAGVADAPADDGVEEAPPAEGVEAAPTPVLRPPSLIEHAEAEYPEAAQQAGEAGQVVLSLVIQPSGAITDVTVVQGVSPALDAAAQEAALRLRFSPATRDGEPIPARVHYTYVFELQEVQEEVVEPDPLAQFAGVVVDADTDEPIEGAALSITASDGIPVELALDADGHFSREALEPGDYQVRVSAPGFDGLELQETLLAGQLTEVKYELYATASEDDYGAVARVAPPAREVTRRSIGRTQLTRIAGTRGDALRAVELMPGVARPPLGAGVLIVRGSAPQDSLTMFEGLPVPLLYHFGGLTSFINSRLLDGIDFYPGNFSSRYGRRRGGIVEVQARTPDEEEFSAVLDANFIDASFLVEGPITDRLQMAVAARRSYVDAFLGAVLPDAVSVVAAPVYYDYQWITTFRASDHDRLRLMVFGSSDRMELLFADSNDALTTGGFDFKTAFHRAHASWNHRSDRFDQDVNVSVGRIDVTVGAGQLGVRLDGTEIYGRSESRFRLSDRVRVNGGLDLYLIPGRLRFNGPAPQQSTNNPAGNPLTAPPPSTQSQISAASDFTVVQPGIYLETEFDLGPTRVVLGNRLDYDNATSSFSYDPRLVMLHTLNEQVTLKGGVGMFGQPPDFPESNKDLGNPDLKQTRTVHTSLGVDYLPNDTFKFGLDGFYKHLFNVVVGTATGEAPYFVNEGEGRIYGVELSAKVEPRGSFFGYLSYTLSRSERSTRGGPFEVFDFDQTHIFTLSGSYRLGDGWEAGSTLRLVSGNPRTPILGGSLDLDSGQYSPVYGGINSQRDPMFHRLDIRIEKKWDFEDWKLAAYLDLQNVYNAENPQGRVYNYDYTQSQSVRGLPILPSLGLRGEL